MDDKNLSFLLVKLTGILVIVNALSDFPRYFAYIFSLRNRDLPMWVPLVGGVLPVLIPLLAGLIMVIFSGRIANRLPQPNTKQEDSPHPTSQLEAAAFSVLGAYLLFRAISGATYDLSRFYLYNKLINSDSIYVAPTILPQDFGNFVMVGIEFFLALYLLLGARGLVHLKDRIRGRD